MASMGPGHFCPGNGKNNCGLPPWPNVASMGPGHFCPGNVQEVCQTGDYHTASMGPGHFCPGNVISSENLIATHFSLQWGRGISAPEMHIAITNKLLDLVMASMGPGHFCPGNDDVTSQDVTGLIGFNGAGAFLPRKCTPGWFARRPTPRFNGAGAFLPRKWALANYTVK